MLKPMGPISPVYDSGLTVNEVPISVRRTVIGQDLIFDVFENIRSGIRRACFKDMGN